MLIAGGGPVGLAAAVELGRRGVRCVVVEPRATVSRARPRCKTINVRSMEHLRRWGIAERLRARAPLAPTFSTDVVFCTSLTGHELSRFTGVLGLTAQGDRFPEFGQQVPQYILDELLRETVDVLDTTELVLGRRVVELDQSSDAATARVAAPDGSTETISADYVLGCDGPRSAVRDRIGASYVGEHAMRPNFGMVFRAPALWEHVRQGRAVQYWTVNPHAPALLGPLDREDTWWIIAFGVDRSTGERDGQALIEAAVGVPIESTVSSTDPWTARMQLVDTLRVGRVFLAGDAAHLNPPFGGHGLNTGIGTRSISAGSWPRSCRAGAGRGCSTATRPSAEPSRRWTSPPSSCAPRRSARPTAPRSRTATPNSCSAWAGGAERLTPRVDR